MKKITRNAVTALLEGKSFKSNNTEVADKILYLHGFPIILCNRTGNFFIKCTGQNANPFAERVNGFFELIGHQGRILKRKDVWYWTAGPSLTLQQWIPIR